MTLTGVCRFRVLKELEGRSGYRRVEPEWRPFRRDLDEPPAIMIDRERLIAALKAFSRVNNLDFNWKAIERIGDYDLSVSLCMACPLEPRRSGAVGMSRADSPYGNPDYSDGNGGGRAQQRRRPGASIMPSPPALLDPALLELLVCPITKQPLVYDQEHQQLISKAAQLAFPIRDGIPIMLASEARALE